METEKSPRLKAIDIPAVMILEQPAFELYGIPTLILAHLGMIVVRVWV